MDAYEAIKEEWKKIPSFQCKPGCHDCCGVIAMTRIEWQNIHVKRLFDFNPNNLTCAYVCEKGCSIYQDRPTICRLFGTADDPRLKCPHGCAPIFKLPKSRAREILRTVEMIGQ